MTVAISPHLRAMIGTDRPDPRCIALEGSIGERVLCTIHPQRASTCRNYLPSFEDGESNPRCDAARAAYGLDALTPADWIGQPDDDGDDDGDTPKPQPPELPQAA